MVTLIIILLCINAILQWICIIGLIDDIIKLERRK